MEYPIGSFVVVRCSAAGVHAGDLVAVEGDVVELKDARRLWYWKAQSGQFLNGVATNGLHPDSKVSAVQPQIHLRDWCEILTCSDTATASIRSIPAFADRPNR